MATQEERLTTLEQEQAKYSEAVSDLNHHVTILTGIISREEWDIREMKSSLRTIDGRLSSLDGRFGSFEQGVNSRFEEQGNKLDQIMLLLNTLTSKPE